MSEQEQDKKNKRTAFVTTMGVNVLVLLVLLFVIAWRAPNPPLPEFGIELNFGMDTQGSGDVQPKEPVGTPQEVKEEEEESKPEETKSEPVEEQPEQVEPEVTKPVEQQVTSKVESPVAVKEEKKEEQKPVEKPKEKPVEKKSEPKVEEKPKVDSKTVYNPNASKSTDASNKKGQPGNHGDDQNKTGDKGSPEGKLDAKSLYGKSGGGGGGSSLDLAGWTWDDRPSPKVSDNELGGIVKFEIKVDDAGDIISIRTLERSVSPETEQACKQAIQRLTFSKTGENVPDISTGTITFVVRSK